MYAFAQFERKNKRKGITVSIIVHLLILLLAILPFIISEPETEAQQAIVIDFREPIAGSSSKSGGSASSSPAARAKVAMSSIAAPTTSTPIQPTLAQPIITAPEPDIVIPEADNFFDQPLEVTETSESDEVVEISDVVSETTSDFDSWAVADSDETDGEPEPLALMDGGDGGPGRTDGTSDFEGEFEGDAESGDDPFAEGFFDGDWPGETDGTEGKNIGKGKAGDGKYWGDFADEGLFNRKVIRRANVARLAIKQGKLVVNLCVDQAGEVVFVECDRDLSTITDDKMASLAEDCARNYIFDQDPGADEKQCGRLTFIFKIDD